MTSSRDRCTPGGGYHGRISPRPEKESGVVFNRNFPREINQSKGDNFQKEPVESLENNLDGKKVENCISISKSSPEKTKVENSISISKRLNFFEEDIGHGVKVKYPYKYRESTRIRQMQVVPIEHAQQQKEYESIPWRPREKIVTGIYDIRQNQQEYQDEEKTTGQFKFSRTDWNDVTVFVSLSKPKSTLLSQNFTAHIKCQGTWTKNSASYEDGVVTFNAFEIDTFCVSCIPQKETFVVSPAGGHFVSKAHPDTQIVFPEGAVNKTQTVTIEVVTVDHTGYEVAEETFGDSDDQPCVLAMSNCVYVNHNEQFYLLDAVKVHLPLNISEWSDDYELVCLHWKNNNKPYIEPLTVEDYRLQRTNLGYEVKFDVHKFTGRQLAVVKKNAKKSIKQVARRAIGMTCRCVILVFVSHDVRNTRKRTLWMECVQAKRVEAKVRAIEEMMNFIEIRQCRSQTIDIEDGERIRVNVGGCGKISQGVRKDYPFLQFFDTNDDRHICFPIDINGGLNRSSFVNLDFLLDRQSKRSVHSAYFDPSLTGKRARPRQRSRSPYRNTENVGSGPISNPYRFQNMNMIEQAMRGPEIVIHEPNDVYRSESPVSFISFSDRTEITGGNTSRISTPLSRTFGSSARMESLRMAMSELRSSIPYDNDVLSDGSLYKLAKKIFPDKIIPLGIELGFDLGSILHIQRTNHDSEIFSLSILKKWVSSTDLSTEKKVAALCTALEEIQLNNLKREVMDAYEENRAVSSLS